MSLIWEYFTLSGRVAFCKENGCNFQKDFPSQAPTTNLIPHLKTHPLSIYLRRLHHPNLSGYFQPQD
jgi:hypothetical protein